jgi:hypothetical protein
MRVRAGLGVSGRGEGEWGNGDATARSRGGLLSLALAAAGRALAVESDRWFLWLPVFFAAGIIAYFALSNEPQPRVAAALCWRNRDLPRAPQCAARACSCRGVSHFRKRLCHGQASYRDNAGACARARATLRQRKRLGRNPRASRQRARAAHHQGPLLGRSQAGGTPLPRARHHARPGCGRCPHR